MSLPPSVGRDEAKLTVLNIAEAEFMKLVHKWDDVLIYCNHWIVLMYPIWLVLVFEDLGVTRGLFPLCDLNENVPLHHTVQVSLYRDCTQYSWYRLSWEPMEVQCKRGTFWYMLKDLGVRSLLFFGLLQLRKRPQDLLRQLYLRPCTRAGPFHRRPEGKRTGCHSYTTQWVCCAASMDRLGSFFVCKMIAS